MLTVVRSDVDAVVATQVTADELFALENDGYRYDLLAGNLIRMSPAGFRHGRLAAEFACRLRAFVGDHPGLGVVVGAETGFRGRGSGRGERRQRGARARARSCRLACCTAVLHHSGT